MKVSPTQYGRRCRPLRILLVAPHPFYQERGTPIAVDLLLRVLSERGERVDLLTFHEGEERTYPGVVIHRTRPWLKVQGVPPGFSAKKLACDVTLFFRFLGLLRRERYDVVHAVEEAAMMAAVLCPLFSVPYIYDMDSLISRQIVDKYPRLAFLEGLLRVVEGMPMRFAHTVVPMCDALADAAAQYREHGICVLKDVSLAESLMGDAVGQPEDVRAELGLTGQMVMYIGNLEPYQGIDLLLESVSLAVRRIENLNLVVIGGSAAHIERYRARAAELGLRSHVHFLGTRPVAAIGDYMRQADVLVSPRTRGVNTPMKIYSYLDSGVAVLATALPTHTQVLSEAIAALVPAEPPAFAEALVELLSDSALRSRLTANAKRHVHREHSYESFRKAVDGIYDSVARAA